MKRVVATIFLFIVVIFLVTVFLSYRTFKKSLTKTKGIIEVQTLKHNVQIYRDNHGVPHIFAQNDDDLLLKSYHEERQGVIVCNGRWKIKKINNFNNI